MFTERSNVAKDVMRDMNTKPNKNLTRKEASAYLRVSIVTLDRAIAKKRIAYFRIGRRVLFSESHLETFLLSNEVKVKTNKREASQNLGLSK